MFTLILSLSKCEGGRSHLNDGMYASPGVAAQADFAIHSRPVG